MHQSEPIVKDDEVSLVDYIYGVDLYINSVLICTVPVERLTGTIRSLNRAGIHNISLQTSITKQKKESIYA